MNIMETYIKAVGRRLNLPKDVKQRVMSDFASSIHARQEAGQTDAQILAELGDAQKAAADLNEQMKEFAYRKSPWRFVFGALAIYGAVKLAAQLLFWMITMETYRESMSIGVIGGADGPTAIFVTSPGWTAYILPALLMVAGIWGFLRLRKCGKK